MSGMLGVARYEFRMQIRKWSLWVSAGLLGLVMALLQGDRGPSGLPDGTPARVVMGNWALLFAIAMPIAFGMVLADRLVRDRRLRVEPLLESLPIGPGGLLAGKYAGGVAATAVPGLVALLVTATGEYAARHDVALFGWAVAAFAMVTLPGVAVVAGFALVCPLVISAPLFRVLFVGYWFWGNMMPPSLLPSLTGTLLTPIGDYAASWLTGETALYAGVPGILGFLRPDPSVGTAALSIAVIVGFSVVPLAVAGWLTSRRVRATWPATAPTAAPSI
jgi:ABC-2 type transport system permease protein